MNRVGFKPAALVVKLSVSVCLEKMIGTAQTYGNLATASPNKTEKPLLH